MNIRKRNQVIILASAVLAVACLWLFVFRNPPQGNNQNGSSQSTAQTTVIKACEAFSVEDAKGIFGSDLSQVPSPDNQGAYTSPTGINDAPQVKTISSSCMYVKGSISPAATTTNASGNRPSVAPAPKGNREPVGSTQSLDQMKKENPKPVSPPQILANITLLTSTAQNAKADFNKAKPKTAKEITGLGDSSFSIRVIGLSGKKQLALTILKGKTIVNITGDNIDIKTAKKIAEVLLKKL